MKNIKNKPKPVIALEEILKISDNKISGPNIEQ